MAPLATVDALPSDLTRQRFRLAAASGGWTVTQDPISPRVHAGRALVELDTLLALGVVPATVGGACGDGSVRAVAGEAGITLVDASLDADPLRAAGVDLVVVSAALASTAPQEMAGYADLGVPVVHIPDDDVVEQLRLVGAALGVPARAATIAADVQARLDGFVAPSTPTSITAFTDRGDGRVYVSTPASPLGRLLSRIGLPDVLRAPTDSTAPMTEHEAVAVPRSRLHELDADLVIGLEIEDGALSTIEADFRFADLPAVRAGRYRRLDPTSSYALAVPSVLTIGIALDALGAALSA